MAHAAGNGPSLSNRILSLLPRPEYERLAPHFDYVLLPARLVLYRPDDQIPHVYFPLGGTVSLTALMAGGAEVEVGAIGREGFAGMPVFLGTDTAPLGAVVQLDNFVSEWSEHYGVRANYHGAGVGDDRLTPEVEVNLYRIAQEALNNVMKHAEATSVGVLLERRDGEVVLIVEDDGKGFQPGGEAGADRGMGLIGMRERAAQVGGTLEVESAPGAGTTVYARVPARDAAPEVAAASI